VTLIGMWVGSRIFRTSEEEQKRVDEFFSYMDVPTEPKVERAGKTESPFGAVGLAILLLGFVIFCGGLVMRFVTGDARAFLLNMLVSGVMLVIGTLLWVGTRSKATAQQEET